MAEHVAETDSFVLRITENEKELTVYVNRKLNGKETKPLAYLLGSNCLILTKKK